MVRKRKLSADSPEPERRAGSPQPGEPAFIVVGKLRRPHGVRGELIFDVLTDFPERLQPGVVLYIGAEYTPYVLKTQRQYTTGFLVGFEEYSNPESAAALRNQYVFVRVDDRPALAEGEYYHHQLIGLTVLDTSGAILGKITEILQTGANDVYVVQPEGGSEILLPAIPDVIQSIDLEAGEMRVTPLAGLLPD